VLLEKEQKGAVSCICHVNMLSYYYLKGLSPSLFAIENDLEKMMEDPNRGTLRIV
jgi:hypothetical protein